VFDIRKCSARSIGFTTIFVLVTFALGCPHYSSGVPPALRLPQLKPNNPVAGVYHKVERNERLSEIAKAYDVDLQHLAEVNNLRPPYSIKADTKVFVPGASQQRPVAVSQKPPTEELRVQDFGGSLAWPVEGKIISEYGVRGGIQYNGIGIQAKEGTPVTATADGRVGRVGTIGEYGKVVLIEHANRLVTVYAHLKEIRVANDQSVKRGEIIGTVGTSGRVETPSLYFEVRSRSKPRNPLFFLGRRA
jgi:lipoprotein NlpD